MLEVKSENFKGLVFISNMLYNLKWKGKLQMNVWLASEWKIREYRVFKPFW